MNLLSTSQLEPWVAKQRAYPFLFLQGVLQFIPLFSYRLCLHLQLVFDFLVRFLLEEKEIFLSASEPGHQLSCLQDPHGPDRL